ncbi:hypothetical protein F11_02745 [Rhodospirillum rubrum F11]|uniref:EamA domain-containing protein n=2 Tax=Rhodospirillum rubrum TaxID=1085 RepID=Q2RX06_RHORT|nr:Protein of unknown function DUF6, transmembrane [Rhodospirillum rubrum ATCC 11170]AEO47019.1 hypothetical protein F11_02745 [Rhodospirillum rubrum F11]MBK5952925.1 EamA family transporter [Rhodospirillum rubrum]HAQ00188.1 EamA/RhaT family transporter [Rhodospirillum rubrum]HCF16530.1 EamA/RhaT family transporter [Rhodospirillum rubrum]
MIWAVSTMSVILFCVVVLCWGFTWFGIHLQLGTIAPEVSILWRFLLAAIVLAFGLAASGRFKPAPLAHHPWFALLGLCLFSTNFVLMYSATQYIASGIVSVVFCMATVFNAANQWLFLKRVPAVRTVGGALIGIAGIALLFGESFLHVEASADTALGVALALGGTYVFSLGNLVSLRATASGTDLPNAVVRAMAWGSVFLALFVLARGVPFAMDWSARYVGSLLYLAIPGSVIGFTAYLSLVSRIGPDRAAYSAVLFPVVALTVSTLFEGYQWSAWAMAGLPLILIGNLVIFARLPARWRRAAA